MPHKTALAFFSLALLSSVAFAGNAPNRDVTCPMAIAAGPVPEFRACVLPLQPDGPVLRTAADLIATITAPLQ
jgi:hypothetical protein